MMKKTIAINVVVVILLLVVVEVVCRAILAKVYTRDFDSSLIEEKKYLQSDGLKANASGVVWGKQFNIDEFGCRKGPKPFNPKLKKWLFIGDSVTEGVGVEDSATFTSLLAAEVDSLNVMNYSLIGYSTADYVNVLSSLTATDSTISRVSIIFCLNDVYGKAKTKDLPVMAKQNFIGKLNGFLQGNYATYKLLKLFVYRNADNYFNYDLQFYKEGDSRYEKAMYHLLKCDSLCKAHGIVLDVIILPYRSQLKEVALNDVTPQKLIEDYCLKHKIKALDIYSAFARYSPPNSLYLFADEIHLSPLGHRAVAGYLLSH